MHCPFAYVYVNVAGRDTVRNVLLPREVAVVDKEIKDKLEQSENITMGVDGWTSTSNASVYASTATFPDRSYAVVDVEDVSAESHTAAYLTGRVSHDADSNHSISHVPTAARVLDNDHHYYVMVEWVTERSGQPSHEGFQVPRDVTVVLTSDMHASQSWDIITTCLRH
jgi:hypothetical protein